MWSDALILLLKLNKERKMVRVGVILAGCGFLDGSEIHESTLTLLYLDRLGSEITCMGPDIKQHDVVNHLTTKVTGESRDILAEAARIARGKIKDIKEVGPQDIDALILPGGYGSAKNLCNFAIAGADYKVNYEVEQLIIKLHKAGKPMGFICIAPMIAANVLGKYNPELTIGNDKATFDVITKMGAKHIVCNVDEICVDERNKIVSTPAYMLGPGISDIAVGIEKLVAKVIELT